MKYSYVFKSGIKFMLSKNLCVIDQKILDLPEDIKRLILKNRMLFPEDISNIKDKDLWFEKVKIKYSEREIEKNIALNFTKSSKKKSHAIKISSSVKFSFYMKDDLISFSPGIYFFKNLWPEISNKNVIVEYFVPYSPIDDRDQWVLKKITSLKSKAIFELGCGLVPRFFNKLKCIHPKMHYKGIDKTPPSGDVFLKGDFLKTKLNISPKTTVIAIEVIEHLNISDLFKLIDSLYHAGIENILITTPDRSYNKFINVKIRHDDHQFEWTYKEANSWLLKLKSKYYLFYKIHKIGRSYRGVSPSLGIWIAFHPRLQLSKRKT